MEEVFVILSANLIILVFFLLLFLIDLFVGFGIIIVPSNLFDNVHFLPPVVFSGNRI